MNITTVITVNGTKKSERGAGLDDGETSQFTINPDEYDQNLNSVSELVARIEHSAYTRGEWISSFRINDVDIVHRIASEALMENHGNIDAAVKDLAKMGMFCNAEATDLQLLLMQAAESLSGKQ